MRLHRLELIRYGKFTDAVIELPRAEKDCHFIVGPNEAGKSTSRAAIAELLFGMPRSSSLGFLHPQSELRLGAVIENSAGELAFHRTKNIKNSLRTPSDSPLSDDALAPFLGRVDKSFFEQMFSLDHTQLIRGGQDILDASKDVGQILFQSAAGIASLGRVRDALAEEADTLWGPRKSADRAYYIGAQRLDEANTELKDAIVRTKAWSEAHNILHNVEERFHAAQDSHRLLEIKRSQLERVRRTAPYLATLREKEAALGEFEDVIMLPPDAGAQLSNGQAELAAAEQLLQARRADVERLQNELNQIVVDEIILTFKKEIESLEAMCHRCRDHRQDLLLRGAEISSLLDEVKTASVQLGWPDNEESIRSLLPSSLVLRTVSNLIKERGALKQATVSDEKAVQRKQEEISLFESRLAAIPAIAVSPAIRTALAVAQTMRNTSTKQRTLAEAEYLAKHELDSAMQALGTWQHSAEKLKAMIVPSDERLADLKAERQRLVSAHRLAEQQFDEAQRRLSITTLETEQYSQIHRIVTSSEVTDARLSRDAAWTAVKIGEKSLEAGASEIDVAMQFADELVDAQLGCVTESTELQSLQHRLEREKADVEHQREMLSNKNKELSQFEKNWMTTEFAVELNGMLLDDVSAWLDRREVALAAVNSLDLKKRELLREMQTANEASEQLRSALTDAGVSIPDEAILDVLCSIAESHIRGVEANATQRESILQQIEQGKIDLAVLRSSAKESTDAYQQWQNEWKAVLSQAKLGEKIETIAGVEAAVELVSEIETKLVKVNEIRRDRINAMQVDLERLSTEAQHLVKAIDIALIGKEEHFVSGELSRRLAAALRAKQDAEHVHKELKAAHANLKEATVQVDSVAARIRPLLQMAGIADLVALLPLVERSDEKRGLLSAIETAKLNLSREGDGLTVAEIFSEVEATDVTNLQVTLAEVNALLSNSVKKQAELATERAVAEKTLAEISGRANAAIAEAKRQEALASMAEASERYIKVATATKLLRWAIDRYRDRKQGPMLSRAGTIFSRLTLGRFTKLIVDYDKEPLTLAALRTNGQVVEISGMSEGTRDQLYLALRLAAMELHLEQATALPFIADDLFVNFDDERAKAGIGELGEMSKQTQVIFFSHHSHMIPMVQEVLGSSVNIVQL